MLNLGNPGGLRPHPRADDDAIVASTTSRYLKWDHNRDLVDAGHPPTGAAAVHEQTLAVYRLMDELKRAAPAASRSRSCSSGGGRVDLGVLERTDRVWVTDYIDPLDRQQMLRWTGQLVPAEMLGSHVASAGNHTTGRTHDLSFRAGTALFGHFGIEWDLARASERDIHDLAEWIAFYKEHRALMHTGDLVRADDDRPGLPACTARSPPTRPRRCCSSPSSAAPTKHPTVASRCRASTRASAIASLR